MERLTEKRDGKNVIPLRNVVCGVDMPNWKISRANALASFLYGDAADRLAAYEETGFSPEDLQFLSETVFSGAGEAAETIEHYKELYRAETAGKLIMLPCNIGDQVRDKIADYVFTVEQIELGHKAGTLFRCGNPGTKDYMAFYDFEIGEKIEVLPHEGPGAALKDGENA